MNNDVIKTLKDNIKTLTNSQANVADYIIKNQTESAFLTIDQLARRVGTSTTTIVRMIGNIGYNGYVEFQKELQNILKNQLPQVRLKTNLEVDLQDDFIVKSAQTQIDNIQNTLKSIDPDVVNSVISSLINSGNIFVTGFRMSYSVAHYLNQGINRLTGKSQLLTSNTEDLPERMLTISPNDVFIAISFPRYTRKTLNMTKIARERGAKIIAITDGYNSVLSELSDYLIPCEYESVSFHNSPFGSLFVADYLISVLAFQQLEQTEKRLEEVNEILKEMNSLVIDI